MLDLGGLILAVLGSGILGSGGLILEVLGSRILVLGKLVSGRAEACWPSGDLTGGFKMNSSLQSRASWPIRRLERRTTEISGVN